MSDALDRHRALDPQTSFIVSAPAGSGKTELLIQRFLRLLTTVRQPEAVLALTFTNKAASEMQQRIIKALASSEQDPHTNPSKQLTNTLASAVKQHAHQLGWNLQQNPQRLNIKTIDGFCMYLVKRMPVTSGIGAVPAISTDPTIHYRNAAHQLLASITQQPSYTAALEVLLQHFELDANRLETLLASLLSCRDQWLAWAMHFDNLSISAKEQHANAILKQLLNNELDYLNQLLDDKLKQPLLDIMRQAGANLASIDDTTNPLYICRNMDSFPQESIVELKYWQALAHLLLDSKGQLRKSVNKRQGFLAASSAKNEAEKQVFNQHKQDFLALLPQLNHELAAQLKQVRYFPATNYSAADTKLLDAILEILPHLVAQLLVEFASSAEVDYTYISSAATSALATSIDLRLYLESNINHLLVDEFQDISVSQYQLLAHLTSNWVRADNSLFLVGDPMQSIYRFRQANVSLFMQITANGWANNLPLQQLQLTSNFRSQAALVNWVNKLFSQLMPSIADIDKGAIKYTPANPSLETDIAPVHWHINHASVAPHDELYPPSVGQIISQLQQLTSSYPDNSIAVLVRSRSHIASLLPALRAENIAINAIEMCSLAAKPLITDLLTITRVLLHPADRIAWLALLRAPWCGLLVADLYALAQDREVLIIDALAQAIAGEIAISADGLARLTGVYQAVISIQAQADLSLSNQVEKLWYSLGGDKLFVSSDTPDELRVYLDLVDNCDNDLAYLTEQLHKTFVDNLSVQSNIHLLTIHKAKGLEFDHVLLPSLHSTSRSSAHKLLLWEQFLATDGTLQLIFAPLINNDTPNSLYTFLRQRDGVKNAHEAKRLLYVALTRAKRSVHLFADVAYTEQQWQLPAKGSFLSYLWAVFEQSPPDEILDNTQITAAVADGVHEQQPLMRIAQPLIPTLIPTLNPIVLTASEANTEFSEWVDPTDRAAGELMHGVLMQLAQQQLPDAYQLDKQECMHILANMSVPHNRLATASAKVIKAVNNMLADDKCRWLLDCQHTASVCECPLSGYAYGSMQHRVVDRSFIDKAGVRWIIDYKLVENTDKLAAAQFIQAQYQQYKSQLEAYAQLYSSEGRSIKLALCLPLLPAVHSWDYVL
jgi:ATP-dependent helicase/nuclease subunit A